MNARSTIVVLLALLTVGAIVALTMWGRHPMDDQESADKPSSAADDRLNQEPAVAVTTPPAGTPQLNEPRLHRSQSDMIERDLKGRDITDPRVLRAMADVPREEFVDQGQRPMAYADRPLPIGHGQTISQPYIVALMTQLAGADPGEKALDVGTGSGYQAAVLAEICDHVYGIEIVEPLAKQAKERLARLGYGNVTVRAGDGYRGWPDHAPFDVIIVAAAPKKVPEPLIEQLAPGGRLVIPVGDFFQELVVIEKQVDGTTTRRTVAGVAFVPMTGEVQER
jgi:protein-L-isoaspartate(D-aspartate) O-methyltransferase